MNTSTGNSYIMELQKIHQLNVALKGYVATLTVTKFWSTEELHTVNCTFSHYNVYCQFNYCVKIYYNMSLLFLIWILCKQ